VAARLIIKIIFVYQLTGNEVDDEYVV